MEPDSYLISYLQTSAFREAFCKVIVPMVDTRSIGKLIITCRVMFNILRKEMIRRKKTRNRALSRARKQTWQPQPQPQKPPRRASGYIARLGKYRYIKTKDRNRRRLTLLAAAEWLGANHENIQIEPYSITSASRYVVVYFTENGIVVRKEYQINKHFRELIRKWVK